MEIHLNRSNDTVSWINFPKTMHEMRHYMRTAPFNCINLNFAQMRREFEPIWFDLISLFVCLLDAHFLWHVQCNNYSCFRSFNSQLYYIGLIFNLQFDWTDHNFYCTWNQNVKNLTNSFRLIFCVFSHRECFGGNARKLMVIIIKL